MSPVTALSLVALLLLALALGWRNLALTYMAKLRARRPNPTQVWLVYSSPPFRLYQDPHDPMQGQERLLGAYATRPLAEAAVSACVGRGEAASLRPCRLYYAREWLPTEKSLCQKTIGSAV